MSYPTLIQSLPSPLRLALRDPVAIAAIVSVGIHGLLWAVLPRLNFTASAPSEPEIQREVGLVELTPEEQSRVPQFDDFTMPPASALPVPSGLPSTTRQPDLFSLSPLPPQPPIPYPSSSFYIPLPQPSIRTRVDVTPINPRSSSRNTPSQRIQEPQSSATPSPDDTLARIQENSRTPEQLNGRIARLPLQLNPSPLGSATATPSAPADGANAVRPTSPATSTPTSTPTQTLAEAQRQLQNRYRRIIGSYSAAGTTQEDARQSFVNWYRDLGKEWDGNLPTEQINAAFPRDACILQRAAAVTYGVVVSKDDAIVGDPRLLMSSGFPIFNDAALEAVKQHSFNNGTSSDQTYQVNVDFEFSRDVCPNVAASSAPPS